MVCFICELHGSLLAEAVALFYVSPRAACGFEHDAFLMYNCLQTTGQLECVCTIPSNSKCSQP
jgi:hypothetical protein